MKLIALSGVVALAFAAFSTTNAEAQEATNDVDYGRTVYTQKAQCSMCHGANGDGHGDDPREHGADLHASKLSPQDMVEVVSCGRPSTSMPHFDKFAYTDKRCYGSTAGDLGAAVPPDPPMGFLTKTDIQAAVDYVQTTFVGKPVAGQAGGAAAATVPAQH